MTSAWKSAGWSLEKCTFSLITILDLVMMHEGRIVLDIDAEEKVVLNVADLVERFEAQSGSRFVEDRMLLRRRTQGS